MKRISWLVLVAWCGSVGVRGQVVEGQRGERRREGFEESELWGTRESAQERLERRKIVYELAAVGNLSFARAGGERRMGDFGGGLGLYCHWQWGKRWGMVGGVEGVKVVQGWMSDYDGEMRDMAYVYLPLALCGRWTLNENCRGEISVGGEGC